MKYKLNQKFFYWLAWKLPLGLVMWCFVRVMSNASSGKWGNEHIDEIAYKSAYDRFVEMNPSLKNKGF